MVERIILLGPSHRIIVDDTALTWKHQWWDGAAWKDVMSYKTDTQRINRVPLLTNVEHADGELVFGKLKQESATSVAVEDVDREIAHALGLTPTSVTLTPKTTAVVGVAYMSAKSASSITIRASISGVDIDYSIVA